MVLHGLRKKFAELHLSLKSKLTLSLSSVAAILLVSSIISVLEYSRMSSYMSEAIAENINNINVARNLADATNRYNLEILKVIGDDTRSELPDFNQKYFLSHCDSLRRSITSVPMFSMVDTVLYSYSAYMLTSLELNTVLLSDFIDSREWYFERLQPRYDRLRSDIDYMSSQIYSELKRNSETFDRGFYRSIVPGMVAVGVGLLLVLMLLFFILAYYVNPLYKMLDNLKNYRMFGKKYTVQFEGDDQLSELNDGITDITESNNQLRKRLTFLKRNENQ